MKGVHLIHAIITGFFNILFTLLSTLVALTFFEPKMASENRTSRSQSMGEVIFILNKVFC